MVAETFRTLDEETSLRLARIDDQGDLCRPPELAADVEVPGRKEDAHPRMGVIPADSVKLEAAGLEGVELAVEFRPGLLGKVQARLVRAGMAGGQGILDPDGRPATMLSLDLGSHEQPSQLTPGVRGEMIHDLLIDALGQDDLAVLVAQLLLRVDVEEGIAERDSIQERGGSRGSGALPASQ
jgi:hypothetical protein